jgi:hypothetical protein
MFLIAKIVRGRRLLHQLEQEVEKEKAAKVQEQREKLAKYGFIPHHHHHHQPTEMNNQEMEIELKGGEAGMANAGMPISQALAMELGSGTADWEIVINY